MIVTQKTRYALRAVLELAKRAGQGPVKISEIARAQKIPPRFLEVILSQLKRTGIVESRRGNEGGYMFSSNPATLNVLSVIEAIQGPIDPVNCAADVEGDSSHTVDGDCIFQPIWDEACEAIRDVYQSKTFQDIIEQEMILKNGHVPAYSI